MDEQRDSLAEQVHLQRRQVPSYGTLRRSLVGLEPSIVEAALPGWAPEAMREHTGVVSRLMARKGGAVGKPDNLFGSC